MNLRMPSSSRLMQQGYGRARTWRVRKSRWYWPILALTFLGALAELFLITMSVAQLIMAEPKGSLLYAMETKCKTGDHLPCGLLQGIVMPFLTLALASVAYLFFRFTRVSRAYLHKARENPRDLVQTAGGIFGRVVGRDQLCAVLMEDLRDSRFRRTHVVVGGIGTGKTALLVLLTRQLARRGAPHHSATLTRTATRTRTATPARTGTRARTATRSKPLPRRSPNRSPPRTSSAAPCTPRRSSCTRRRCRSTAWMPSRSSTASRWS
ncbi:hypothetical protein ACF1AL_27610 [Streptomyces sp. NPDC014801]|uniref:hypothetical protein n=1 Tax=Streptomyces sp. NPDC014801 TaxID=3364916 RepID=UPI0037016900